MELNQPLPTTFKNPVSVHTAVLMKCPLWSENKWQKIIYISMHRNDSRILQGKYSKCCSSVMHQFAIRQVQMLLMFLHKHWFIQWLFIRVTKYEAPPLQIKCTYCVILIYNEHEPFLTPGEITSPQKCKRQIKMSVFSNVLIIHINHSSHCPIGAFFLVSIFTLNTQNPFRPRG